MRCRRIYLAACARYSATTKLHSKATWCFTGCIAPWNLTSAKAIAGMFELVAIRCHGGHNRIHIGADNGTIFGDDRRIELDPSPGADGLSTCPARQRTGGPPGRPDRPEGSDLHTLRRGRL